MKTLLKQSILKTLAASLVSAVLMPAAMASHTDLTGSYSGTNDKKEKLDLMMRPIVGREGSYLAVLIRFKNGLLGYRPQRVSFYRIDPLKNNSLDLTPMNVTADGFIGVNNSDPSLVLNISNGSDKNLFTITSANSGNTAGFQDVMTFNKKTSNSLWGRLQSGAYWLKNGPSRALEMTAQDGFFQATATFTVSGSLNGNFDIQEKQPGLFTLRAVAVKSTGAETEEHPRKIGVPVERNNEQYFVLVDPSNDTDVMLFGRN
ncbi:MAG: hypothetical protein AABZ06_14925 [Bdellovibrionota bacterium]